MKEKYLKFGKTTIFPFLVNYDVRLHAYTCEKCLEIHHPHFSCVSLGRLEGPLVWKPLTSGSGKPIFSLDDPDTVSMLTSICPCWNALERDPWIRVSCRGAALSLTLTSELPGAVEKRWKNFPAGISKTVSLKQCDTFLAWVVWKGIKQPGF